ncbi:MAG: hypothetical protein IK116_02530 [Firmicutes bacterium]|nr:hypothetical protein [Bacillota bacterium]
MNGKLEKIMRVLTLPPLVAILTAALLWLGAGMTGAEFAAAALLLGLVPLLAYPLWELFPNQEDRRSGQRTYALYCSVAGYAIGFLWSQLSAHTPELRVLFSSYVISVVILILLSKLAGFKASGHACSSTAPLVLITWKLGLVIVPLGLLILFAVYYSSLRLGRHTLAQLLAGSSVSLAAGMGSIMLLGCL